MVGRHLYAYIISGTLNSMSDATRAINLCQFCWKSLSNRCAVQVFLYYQLQGSCWNVDHCINLWFIFNKAIVLLPTHTLRKYLAASQSTVHTCIARRTAGTENDQHSLSGDTLGHNLPCGSAGTTYNLLHLWTRQHSVQTIMPTKINSKLSTS